jgi:biopolymer transport protein TolR
MPRTTTIVELREIKEINLTPLIDLTFLLLITFIITFPLIEQGIPVQLPRTTAEDTVEASARTVTLDREGRLFLDEMGMDAAQLAQALQALGREAPDTVIRLRADEAVTYGKLAEVLRMLRGAGLFRLALVMQAD